MFTPENDKIPMKSSKPSLEDIFLDIYIYVNFALPGKSMILYYEPPKPATSATKILQPACSLGFSRNHSCCAVATHLLQPASYIPDEWLILCE